MVFYFIKRENNICFFGTVPDPLDQEKIDLVFAVSASSTEAEQAFHLMKETLLSIVSTHGMKNIHYTVMTYGSLTRTIVDFQDGFPDEQDLLKKLESLSTVSGTPDLDLALANAKKAFEASGARPDAKKVLVYLVDNKSGSTEQDVLKSAMALEEDGVKVIPVGIGSKVNRQELEKTTPLEKNIIEVPIKENPEKLSKKIMKKVRESEYIVYCFLYILTVLLFFIINF